MAGPQFIFQMQGLTKAYPGGKKVFENIWLSFYPDAKIGVVGVNGSGKSTLLKIMSGIDTEFSGEAKAADGIKRGYLAQEPHLDEALELTTRAMRPRSTKADYIASSSPAALDHGPMLTKNKQCCGPALQPCPCPELHLLSRRYFKCLLTALVIWNMSTCFLPPKTAFSLSSALIIRLFFWSCSLFFLM